MQAQRRRLTIIAAGSAAIHAAIFAALAIHAPRLRVPPPVSATPEAVIPVLIMPRALPPTAEGREPTPIRLHRRTQPFNPEEELPVAPLVAPETPAEAPAAARGPAQVTGPPVEAPIDANAQRALRGLVGCANPSVLPREEREKGDERLAAGARGAAPGGLGIDDEKESAFSRAAARKAADREYRNRTPEVGTPGMNDPSAPGRIFIPPTTPKGSTRDGRVAPMTRN